MNKLIITLFIVGLTISAKAQMNGPTTVPSPTAATLGEFGKTPISYFTGTPLIDVPIHTVSMDGLELPIILGYSAKGIKPDQHPGWVGLNWNLNVSGVIIRVVNGRPDEDYYSSYWKDNTTQYISDAGFYYNYNVCNNSLWETYDYVKNLASNKDKYLKDNAPDEFFFHVGNISGSFYLGHDGKWKVKSNNNVKIQFDNFIPLPNEDHFYDVDTGNKNNKTFSGFTLTDDKGFKYTFGGSLINIDLSSRIASTWHLSQISSPNGQIMEFEYEKDNSIVTLDRGMNYNYKTESKSGAYSCTPVPPDYPRNICRINKIYSTPSYLTKISTPTETLTFSRSNSQELRFLNDYLEINPTDMYDFNTLYWKYIVRMIDPSLTTPTLGSALMEKIQWKKLDKLSIASKLSPTTPILSFEFVYSNDTSERLKLLSLKKMAKDNNVQKYDFKYYDDPLIQLPPYASVQVDHWGYYNAKQNNTDLNTWNTSSHVPLSFFENYWNEREPSNSINVLQEGSLKRMYYPTGGYSEYVYEPHTYSKEVSKDRSKILNNGINKSSGGLRIKKIIDVSVGSPNVEREFYYVNEYGSSESSGVLNGQSKYYFEYTGIVFNSINYSQKEFSSHGLLPFSGNDMGIHIGYTSVIEKQIGNGYTIYNYSNFDNGHLDENVSTLCDLPNREYTIYDPFNDKSIERGRLLQKSTYNELNKIVSKEVNHYKVMSDEYVRSINPSSIASCVQNLGFATCFSYRTYNYKYNLVQKDQIHYDSSGLNPLSISNYYTYNPENLIREAKKTDSKGKDIITEYKYPSDFIYRSFSYEFIDGHGYEITNANTYGKMVDKNMINHPIEIVSSVDNKVISSEVIDYKEKSVNNNLIIVPAVSKKLDPISPLSDYMYGNVDNLNGAFVLDSRINDKLFYDSYDNSGNLTMYHKTNGIYVTTLWGYNKAYPIAQIENATFDEIASALAIPSYQLENFNENNLSQINSLRSVLPNAMVSSYTYTPLIGITSMTDPKGYTIYYEYDSFNRLKYVKDKDGNILSKNEYHYKGQ